MSTPFDSEELVIPDVLPLLPVRDVVVFPYMILPLFVGRDVSIRAVNEALAKDRLILLSAQKQIGDELPNPDAIYTLGTVAMIMRMRKLPDGRIKILAQGLSKARITNFENTAPFYSVRIEKVVEETTGDPTIETEALMRSVREQLEKVISLGKTLSPDILMVLDDIRDPGRLADLIVSNLGLKVVDSQKILEMTNPTSRLNEVNEILRRELEILEVQQKMRVQQPKDEKNQRDYFLREQIKAIKNELGESDNKNEDINDLRDKLTNGSFPEEVRKEALKQLGRLERMHPDASEASIIRTYLEWIIDIPWATSSKDHLDIKNSEKVLNEDHFGLDKVKERILEFLAVRKLKNDMKGPILCLVGPPGVGKTSLGRSIARAMGREFIRISLGGVRDEAEIRGHRRTYVGAMPGRVVQGLKQAKVNNPIFMLDEIDKLGADFRGDPASALLEVLDPEQNFNFRDHYMNLPIDLTNVMFIATANVLDTIPPALRDRMEIIQIPGYSEEDKLRIAKQFLGDKQVKENGIDNEKLQITDDAWKKIINEYTRESGLRSLERAIGKVCRKIAKMYVESLDSKEEFKKIKVDSKTVEKLLGPPMYLPDEAQLKDEIGVVTGLAWTEHGGEILQIEVTKMKGKGGLILTGQLGDVMKESGQAAMSFIRANANRLGLREELFSELEIHLHVPAGAIPKDGPSAGIAMATGIVSLLTGIAVSKDVAMTGEITLVGKVLPIGGLKEKSLAAMRHGVHTIVIPRQNAKDLVDIPKEHRKKVQFVETSTIEEVLRVALIVDPFKDAVQRLESANAAVRASNLVAAAKKSDVAAA